MSWSVLSVHWKDWCWSWNSNTLATWWEELTHWKRPWCWERLKMGGEGDDRGWDGWMASLTQWTRVWVNSGVGDGQGGLACCDSWGRKDTDTAERLNWTEPNIKIYTFSICVHICKYIYTGLHLCVCVCICVYTAKRKTPTSVNREYLWGYWQQTGYFLQYGTRGSLNDQNY